VATCGASTVDLRGAVEDPAAWLPPRPPGPARPSPPPLRTLELSLRVKASRWSA